MSIKLPKEISDALDNLLKLDLDLIPAIAQDFKTGEVLMLAYMNRRSLESTLETAQATYWSRSRNEIWVKGATSGNTQKVLSLNLDCDGDAILMQVEQVGPACHTGDKTCFHNPLLQSPNQQSPKLGN
ncbi:MAG: phosphoribosyl-AMP cyclohydrolase [Candidatus Planktophila sp.]|jgi:phosphoribosyl-AMP cyclohydrolase